MNLVQQFFTVTTMFISLNVAFGVLLHDTNVDKAFLSSWKTYSVQSGVEDEIKMPETKPHTHPEHAQLSNVLKYAARGQHTFDGYHLDFEGVS